MLPLLLLLFDIHVFVWLQLEVVARLQEGDFAAYPQVQRNKTVYKSLQKCSLVIISFADPLPYSHLFYSLGIPG
jgi:hypothetical protein